MLELIIFDCDGVLVDSEAIAARHLRNTIELSGVRLGEEIVYDRFLGLSEPAVLQVLCAEFGVVFTPNDIADWRAGLSEKFRNELKATDGILETIRKVKSPTCVASSSSIARIRHSLETVGLLSFFETHLFSASSVEKGKPAPDLFLYAARMMEANPMNTIVIEDSLAGIAAAKAAGMKVFAFVGGAHLVDGKFSERIEALQPDLIFSDMRKLPQLLELYGS